ncbi:MAG: phosphotransferase family protein, partial [Solirubrobacteraceae bacterium]
MSDDGWTTTGHELPPGFERALRMVLSLEAPPRQLAIHDRPNTTLRVLETERGRVWVKSYRGSGDDALREYQFLRRAQDALRGAAALAVPEPIARLGSTTIVLCDVSGRPMRGLLADGSDADCEAAVRRCGEWLAAVHRAGAKNTKAFDLRLAARFVAARWDGLADRASRLAFAASAWDRAGVVTHGDFAPHNVIVDRERVVVLDPSFH